jgi:predicted nucleotidyltransferase component of viral defense system
MASSPSGLTSGQERLIRAFFARTDRFFLTGGSALAGFYLHHRTSGDLDLFTLHEDAFQQGKRLVEDAVRSLGGTVEPVREYPGFAELRATLDGEAIKVDLVRETVAQVRADKPRMGGAVVDAIEDIAANKICAVVGRCEVRDFVDLYFLAKAGQNMDEAIARAREKDAGVEPATLAWILGQVRVNHVPPTLLLPLSAAELQAFIDRLAADLARKSFPG